MKSDSRSDRLDRKLIETHKVMLEVQKSISQTGRAGIRSGDLYNLSRGIVEQADFLKPDVIQLHGQESLSLTEQLISELNSRGIKVIKALRFSADTGELKGDIRDPVTVCERLASAGINGVVLDSVTGSRPGRNRNDI